MIDFTKIDFDKSNGLIPAIIQDKETLQVLMLGYMNEDALQKTVKEGNFRVVRTDFRCSQTSPEANS